MKIVTLMENTTIDKKLDSEHGLCFYIEIQNHKILVDLGPNRKFIDNAQKLNVDLSSVDTVLISHAHDDHGGGLRAFMDINKNAKIYVRRNAFDNYYVNDDKVKEYIGLDKELKNSPQIVFTDDYLNIDNELSIFSNIKGRKLTSKANETLMAEVNGKVIKDVFSHEQCLVINENDKYVVMGGCAHNGIINILEKFEETYKRSPNYVISGFHLFNPSLELAESDELITSIAEKLCKLDIMFYTCHCTGIYPYELLKSIMKDKIEYLSTGTRIEI